MLREETPVATLALPTHDQQIRLDAVAIDGRLVAKGLATTRASGIAAALAAQPIEDVPQIVSQLFPLCGTAHAIASLTAIEAALGLEVSPAQLVFREMMLLAEHGAALGWRILMDWPPLLGNSPDVRACAAIDRAPRRRLRRRRRDGCPRRRAHQGSCRGAAANPSRSAIPMRRHARRAASTLGKRVGPATLRALGPPQSL